MKHNTPWFSLCIPLFLALAAPAQGQEAHSAVAEYEGEGGWSLGYALGYDTRAEAGAKALQLCNKNDVGNCIVAYRFSGPGCIAVAEGPDSLGYSIGGDRSQMAIMKKQALSECQKDGENCRIVDSDCVGSGEVAESNVVEKDSQKTGESNTASAQQEGPLYSAVAEHEGEEGWSLGYALGYDTQTEANAKALELCNKNDVGNCIVAYQFTGTGCVAVAEGPDSLGYSVGGYPEQIEEMKKEALSECQKDGENCRIVDSNCVGSVEITQSNAVEKDS